MYTGSCLCRSVRFEIHGGIRNVIHCHCSRCRKAQGSAFATNGIVSAGDFRILSGESLLTPYASSPGHTRYFCRVCGSPIVSRNTARPGEVRVRLGAIDSEIEERPMAHTFVTSKAGWEDIAGDLPRYEAYEPGR
jgi:hypothetical protein